MLNRDLPYRLFAAMPACRTWFLLTYTSVPSAAWPTLSVLCLKQNIHIHEREGKGAIGALTYQRRAQHWHEDEQLDRLVSPPVRAGSRVLVHGPTRLGGSAVVGRSVFEAIEGPFGNPYILNLQYYRPKLANEYIEKS